MKPNNVICQFYDVYMSGGHRYRSSTIYESTDEHEVYASRTMHPCILIKSSLVLLPLLRRSLAITVYPPSITVYPPGITVYPPGHLPGPFIYDLLKGALRLAVGERGQIEVIRRKLK